MFKKFFGNKISLLLWGIIILATVLRTVNLNRVPSELFGDELDAGYQAYSILKTGRDIRGYKFPIYFHSLSESKAPLYLYSTVPFVAIFGLNEWGVRLPSVFFGMIGILFIYLLTKKIFSDEKIAIFSLLACSILPWHIHYSRAGLEETLLMALVIGGIYFFIQSFNKNHLLLLSILFFILSVYTYPTAVIFTPIIFFTLVAMFRKEIIHFKRNYVIAAMFLLVIGTLPFLKGYFGTGQSQERFSKISIFTDQKSIDKIITKRINSSINERFFHNKITQFSSAFLENYLTSFSPQFLFLKGDPSFRHNSDQGEILLAFAPFFVIGLYELLRQLKDKKYLFTLSWLLVSPVSSALTSDGATHAGRLFVMIPPLVIIIGLGLFKVFNFRNKIGNIFKLLSIVLISLSFIFYLHQYFYHYPKDSWQYWQYGYKDAITQLVKFDQNFERVILNNNHDPILLRFLFWGKIEPSWLRANFSDDQMQKNILPGFNGFRVGKYYFGGLTKREELNGLLDDQTLYLAFQGDEIPGDWNWQEKPPVGIKVLSLIKDPLGRPYIYLLSADK